MRGGVPQDIQVYPAGGYGGNCDSTSGASTLSLWLLVFFCFIVILFAIGAGTATPQTRERVMLQCQSFLEKTRNKLRRKKQAPHAPRLAPPPPPEPAAAETAAETAAEPAVQLMGHQEMPVRQQSTGSSYYDKVDADIQQVAKDVHQLETQIKQDETQAKQNMKDLRAKITRAGHTVDRQPLHVSMGEVAHLGSVDFIRPVPLHWEKLRQKYSEERRKYSDCPFPVLNGSHFFH